MQLGKKSRLFSRIAAINTKFKLTFVALILALVGVGIFVSVNQTSASTPGGASVNISGGYKYTYAGGYQNTLIYTITSSAGSFQGTCAEPTKASPLWSGNNATILNNTSNVDNVIISRVLLITGNYSSTISSAFNNDNPNFWSNLNSQTNGWSTSTPFVIGHILIGGLYTKSYDIMSNYSGVLNNAIQAINAWFGNNYPYEHLNWNLYSTYDRSNSYHDIVWLERSPQYAYLNISKTDSDTGAALSGAKFEFVGYNNTGTRTVIQSGLTTNAQGTLASPQRVTLGDSYTKYCFKETEAPSGYEINSNESCIQRSSLSESETPIVLEMPNTPSTPPEPSTGKFRVYKKDQGLATDDYRSQGGAKLIGTKILVQAVDNCTNRNVITDINDSNYYKYELKVKWLNNTNNTGLFTSRTLEGDSGGKIWVGGSYIIQEVADPDHAGMPQGGTGYKINPNAQCIEITGTQEQQVTFQNEVMKGGFTLTKQKKIGDTVTPFEDVTFHIQGTDSCGNNGCVLKSYDITTDANGQINVSATDADYALPYGHYTITEVCNATTSAYDCSYSEDFEITSDGQVVALNSGNPIVNTAKTPSITTVARHCSSPASNPIKQLPISNTACVTDRIVLSNFVADTDYKIETTLKSLDNGDTLKTAAAEWTHTSGTTYREISFSDVDTTAYANHTLYVTATIYMKDGTNYIPIRSFNEDGSDEAEQLKVSSYSISTAAAGASGYTNNQGELLIGDAKVIDTITISGLAQGTTYKIIGEIVDGNDQAITLKNGATEIVMDYTMEAADNTVISTNMTFDFDTSTYQGQTLEVHERIVDYNDASKVLVQHDGGPTQQVRVATASIGTSAASKADRTVTSFNVGGNVTIEDVITLDGLVNGTTYKLKGWMVNSNGTKIAIENGTSDNTITQDYTMTAASGTTMDFVIDTAQYLGQNLTVCEQLLAANGTDEIVTHCTAGESAQTINVKSASIRTFAKNAEDNTHMINIGTASVIDYVEYHNLDTNTEYTLRAEIYTINDSTLTKIADSEPVSFTPSASDDTTTAAQSPHFTISTTPYAAGTTLVVYEYLSVGSTEIARHTESNNSDQQVTISPITMGTTAASNADPNIKVFNVGDIANIKDDISFIGLARDTTYKIRGWMVDPDGNKVAIENGSESGDLDNDPNTITTSYQMTAASGTEVTTSMNFLVDTVKYAGKKLTVYEQLLDSTTENVIASVEVLADRNQTITINTPQIGTTAVQKGTTSHRLGVGNMEIRDTVTYENLIPGESYTLIGKVMRVADDGSVSVLRINNIEIAQSQTVTAQGTSGSWDMDFALYTRDIQGANLVVYEYLKHGDTEIAKHENPAVSNENTQYIKVKTAQIQTLAKDGLESGANQDDVIEPEAGQKIVDTVSYSGLEPGAQYTITGKVMRKADNTVLEIDGNPVTGQTTFTTDSTGAGTVVMEFSLDATDLPGVDLVVFEKLFEGTNTDGEYLLHHEDLTDPNQHIYIRPRIGTIAADAYDGDQMIGVGNATITDTIKYEGLREGGSYIMIGTLIDKETGEPVSSTTRCPEDEDDNSENTATDGDDDTSAATDEDTEPEICVIHQDEVQSRVDFTIGSEDAPESDGEIEMLFELNTKDLVGKQLVVFEEIYEADGYDETTSTPISWHKDLEDESQTVTVHTPAIRTFALDKADNDRELDNTGIVTITDKVEYSGLVAGTEYTVMGKVMDKATGEQIPFADDTIEEGIIEIAKGDSGYFTVDLPIKAEDLAGRDVVVFEYLYIESLELDEETGEVLISEILLAKHEDLTDAQQTVHVKEKTPDTGYTNNSDDAAGGAILASSAIGAFAIITAVIVIVYKKNFRVTRHRKFEL